MAIFKCKMCGGDLEILDNATVCECGYCGTKQTVPKLDNEKKLALFTRANNLRLKSEFDKAAGIYESIVTEFRDEAEAYWGLVLCKYGIEYVEDKDGSRIPTCHRTLPISVMDDDDFEQACEYADITAKSVYRSEAKVIDKIQKKILKIAHNEAPYDIFICYKETDDITGVRTEDSLIAQDIYTKLIKDGYRVFYARDSLREVAGSDYEPYIYSALSSAKIMLAIGTKFEYYDAVWVKNEWSRFISMMGDDSSKVLIPCFKNMDAYDMPKAFKNMQALDMGEVTFFGDLLDNIERVVGKLNVKTATETIVLNSENSDVTPLLERGFLFLEDEKWQKGDDFFELVLNKDPKNARAYLGKLLVDLEVSKPENLKDFYTPFDDNDNYSKIMRFADTKLKEYIKEQNDIIIRRNEENRKRDIYEKAVSMMANDLNAKTLEAAGYLFLEIKDFNDARDLAEDCFEKAEVASKNATLLEAKQRIKQDSIESVKTAIEMLEEIQGWKDADEQLEFCKKRLEELRLKEIAEKREQERKAEEEKRERERVAEQERRLAEEKAKKNRKLAIIVSSVVACVLVFVIVLNTVIIPSVRYKEAVELLNDGKYRDAVFTFASLRGYKDSSEKFIECERLLNGNSMISAGVCHTVAIKRDGTVVTTGSNVFEECNVDDWMDVVSVFAGGRHTVGLKSDGTVVAAGFDLFNTLEIEGWTNIISIAIGNNHVVGLKSNGMVVEIGDDFWGQCVVNDWNNIVAISAGSLHTVGLKSDGTVVAVGDNKLGQCNVQKLNDIVLICAGAFHTVGLKSDGTVVAIGDNGYGQCDVQEWTDIVEISAGAYHTVALKSDGTVVAVGKNGDGQCNVQDWTDIVSISAGNSHTVGLKSDGAVVATGRNYDGQCNVQNWTDIKVTDSKTNY